MLLIDFQPATNNGIEVAESGLQRLIIHFQIGSMSVIILLPVIAKHNPRYF